MKLFVKKLITIALFYASTLALGQKVDVNPESIGAKYPNGIAAKVADEIITLGDVRKRVAPLFEDVRNQSRTEEQFQANMMALYKNTLDDMINEILVVKDFENDEKLRVPQSFLDNQYTTYMHDNFQGDRSRYNKYLEANGLTDRDVRKKLRNEMIMHFSRGKITQSLAEISPDRIVKYFNNNKLQFEQKEAVQLRQIVLNPVENDSEGKLLQEKASNVLQELKSGRKFGEVAKEFSEDEMAATGGNWGWINRGDIRKELEDKAFQLKKGNFSEPIMLSNYAFILYVEDKQSAGIKPLSEVRGQIEQLLAAEDSKEAYERHVKKIRKNAYVEIFM